jgi:hypothetical protein
MNALNGNKLSKQVLYIKGEYAIRNCYYISTALFQILYYLIRLILKEFCKPFRPLRWALYFRIINLN